MKYQLMLTDYYKNIFWYCPEEFKTIQEAKDYYFQWGVDKDIEEFCKNCEVKANDLSVFVVNALLSTEDGYFCVAVLHEPD